MIARPDCLGVIRVAKVVVEPDLAQTVLQRSDVLAERAMLVQGHRLPASWIGCGGDNESVSILRPQQEVIDEYWLCIELLPFLGVVNLDRKSVV